MSGEQRVTDERLVDCVAVIDRCVLKLANTTMNISLEEWGEISNALLGVGIAHRATEAKLREALAEVERLNATMHRYDTKLAVAETAANWCARALDAESDLAATKARYEEEHNAVSRVWEALGVADYASAKGMTIWEHVAATKAKLEAAREELQRISDRHPNAETSAEHYAGYMARRGLQASALTTQGDTDETTV